MISLQNIGTGDIVPMIMANDLDFQIRSQMQGNLSRREFWSLYYLHFRFVYKNAPLSLVQDPKIKLDMIMKVSSDEYLIGFETKKKDVWKVPSTLATETSQNNNNFCSKHFHSDLMLLPPISSPTGDTTTESSKMVSKEKQ